MPCLSWASGQEIYHTYDPKTGREINRFYFHYEDLPDGKQKVLWSLEGEDLSLKEGQEEYLLNEDANTLWWHSTYPREKTDYRGQREGPVIILKGRLNGRDINRNLKIDDKPFYINPKWGLRHFILSDEMSLLFWSLRNDSLKLHLMYAKKKSEEYITVGGQSIEAVKVEWGVYGVPAVFFKRNYWFRKSDGLFLRQELPSGYLREWLGEGQN